jgi:hypothetical protein
MDPIHSRLSENAQTWYRRIYRPKYSSTGIRERDEVEHLTEEDYVAEQVATLVCEEKSFNLATQRQAAKIRADDDLVRIGEQIARAIQTACSQRPNGEPQTNDLVDDVDRSEVPLTPAIAVGARRSP